MPSLLNLDYKVLLWLRSQLDRYSYRPGWVWRIDPAELGPESSWWPFILYIEFMAQDSRHPDNRGLTIVKSMHSVPCDGTSGFSRDEKAFARWLQQCIFNTEMHESREWLRCDGQIYDDPHRSGR